MPRKSPKLYLSLLYPRLGPGKPFTKRDEILILKGVGRMRIENLKDALYMLIKRKLIIIIIDRNID